METKVESKKATTKELLLEVEKSLANVTKVLSELDPNDIPSHLKAFKLLYELCSLTDSIKKVLDGAYDHLSYEVLPDLFERNELDSVKLQNRNFVLSGRMFCSIIKENEEEAFKWLENHNLSSLIRPTVNAKQLTSAISEYFEQEAKLPPEDIIKSHKQRYIAIRQA